MAKEIAFQIQVEDAALQQLLKDLGNLVTLYDKVAKSQDGSTTASQQYAQIQAQILQTEKQLIQAGSQSIAVNEKQQATIKTISALTTRQEQEDKKATDTIAKVNAEKTKLTQTLNGLNLKTVAGQEAYATYREQLQGVMMELGQCEVALKSTTATADNLSVNFGAAFLKIQDSVRDTGNTFKSLKQNLDLASITSQMSEALNVIDQISELRLQNDLARIDSKRDAEIASVNASVLSQEERDKRIADINAKFDKQAEARQKAAAKRDKAIATTKTIIAGAQAVVQGIAQFGPPPSPLGIAAIASAAVTTGLQLATIAKQKFANGGYIPFETGGMIQGGPHSQGGVPFLSGGNLMEAEGGELIVNRNIWRRPDFVKNISEMNALTGGKRFFAAGGMVPTVSPPSYLSNSTIQSEGLDSDMLIKGLRGVIAKEVGSLKIVNNVVDTTSQQQRLLNIQTGASF